VPKSANQRPLWRPETLGEVIAERDFVLRRASGRNAKVRVRFGKPVLDSGASRGDPWWCPVEVRGAGLDSFRPVAGLDSLQALILALDLVSRTLPQEAERRGFRLDWLGDSERLVLARQALSRDLENGLLSLAMMLRDLATILSADESAERRAKQAIRRIVRQAEGRTDRSTRPKKRLARTR
jgi:hypothetical protein